VATNATCPISGDPIEPAGQKVMIGDVVYGFCCEDCIAEFKANPSEYLPQPE
jgi:YHS domain-containing protein